MKMLTLFAFAILATTALWADPAKSAEHTTLKQPDSANNEMLSRIKDIADIVGVRGNQLTGYGLIIGLDGTGDSKSAAFTAQSLANMLERFGVTLSANDLKVKNVAAVMVTAELPPFVKPGAKIDITVSSLGDAKSLQGGTLIQTPLMGADGKVYAVAAGPISIGGFKAGGSGNSVQKNHVTVGRIPNGAFVEKEVPMNFTSDGIIRIQLRRQDFATAERVAQAINEKFPTANAEPDSAGVIQVQLPKDKTPVAFVADIQALKVATDLPARIVVNERTGVIVIGGNVKIKPVIIAQGGIKVEISTEYLVSQPEPLSKTGDTKVVPSKEVKASEQRTNITAFEAGSVTIDQLVKGLQMLGVSPQDLISILQALKDQGALEAELEVQ